MIFQEKYFPCYILFTDQILLSGFFFLEILDNTCIATICWPVSEVINFEINRLSHGEHKQKFRTKMLVSQERKKLFHHFKKALFGINKNKFFEKQELDF